MLVCKRCGSEKMVKNGIVAGRQRYLCKVCKHNFRLGDNRTNSIIASKKALCVLIHSMADGSLRLMGRILGVDHALIFRWIKTNGESVPKPNASGEILQMEFERVMDYISTKQTSLDLTKPLTMVHGELFAGFPMVLIFQSSETTAEEQNATEDN